MIEQAVKEEQQGKLEFWAILELFGHNRIAGFVREVALGGDVMLRVDVPELRYQERSGWGEDAKLIDKTIAAFTKFYSPKSVYAMTPCTEEAARAAMSSFKTEPVQAFDLSRPALPSPSRGVEDEDDDRHEEEREF